ncbi:uracil-xanthine permease family protein [Anoxynatronum buryatiense]|uniref:Nucleobase:cation symporter-2, NCS2 family n=1 Tax=Anoxynatronum buryatiense TaxID=489973 RepID=A0AA46AJN6_9CLOT|nr:nucleobase:cation symporter-2 family protein [Anoxynatronum buryatiense]SMP62788.1 nucleobase:cation symporter-2, NCS2 family [Anoxynatronum buryatiense]
MEKAVNNAAPRSTSVFDLNGVPALGKAVPLGLQHVLAMIVGNVTPAIIIAGVVGLNSADRTLLVQCAMFIAGIATLLQLYPIGKVGSGLPVIMGVSFAYVPTIIAIGSQYGIAGIFGAQLVGGCVAVLVGIFIKHVRKYFPPLVAGTVVFTIGLSLYPIAINYIAGGVGSPTYGSYTNWAVAIITLSVVLFCNQFAKGYFKLASILVGIAVGYVIAILLNLVSFAPVAEAAWFALPRPLHFGIEFYPPAILSMVIMYIVNSVQAVGDLSATTVGGMGREVTDRELSGGIVGNGVSSIVASFFGGLPTATYSQNVGIVAMTKVVSRFVLGIAAAFILLAGFVPKFGAVMTTIPQSVLGGATITVFAMITMTGIKLIIQDELSGRNMAIVGLAVALGIGITQVPQSLELFPDWVMMVFGRSAVVIATIVAFTLNLILPQKTLADEQQERKEMEQEG